ncbi:MAG: hypothetical protein FJZ60_02535 [Chlamydiae bacterium]|nr:hypothetical protein [Chlamydiota bacterium]
MYLVTCSAPLNTQDHLTAVPVQFKPNPMLSRGLKRTFFALKPGAWDLDLRIYLFIKGLSALDGIFCRLHAETKKKSPAMSIQDVLKERGEAFVSADGKEQWSPEQVEEDLKSRFKVDALQVHQKADVVFESQVIMSHMDPFFVQMEMEPLESVGSDQLCMIRDLFYQSVGVYYEGVVKTSFRRRSDIFKDLKSLWINSLGEHFGLMHGLVADSIAKKYLTVVGEAGDKVETIAHSLGLALINLSLEVSLATLKSVPHPQDLLPWLCKEFRFGIEDGPKTKDLVLFLDARNTPIHFGIVMDGTQGKIRHFLTRVKSKKTGEISFQAGDLAPQQKQNSHEICIGHHHALIVTALLGTIYHEEIAQMVFLRKMDGKI